MSYHQGVCTGVEEQVFFDKLAFALFSTPVCTSKFIFFLSIDKFSCSTTGTAVLRTLYGKICSHFKHLQRKISKDVCIIHFLPWIHQVT